MGISKGVTSAEDAEAGLTTYVEDPCSSVLLHLLTYVLSKTPAEIGRVSQNCAHHCT